MSQEYNVVFWLGLFSLCKDFFFTLHSILLDSLNFSISNTHAATYIAHFLNNCSVSEVDYLT